MFWRQAQYLTDLHHLIKFILPRKQWLPHVHLYQYAAQTPHVNGKGIVQFQQYFRSAIKSTLDIFVHAFVRMTRATEVNYLYCATLRISQQNILRLEVTVDDIDLGGRHEEKGRKDLVSKFSDEVERDTMEVRVP